MTRLIPKDLRWVMLAFKVHLEAFRLAPTAYLTAAKWWVLRKRVRARGQFAPLLGRTSRAYEWASLTKETGSNPPSTPGMPPIIALICDEESNASDLNITLASLAAEHIEAYPIGSDKPRSLRQIADTIDWSSSPWVMPISAGDRIAPGAADAYRAAMAGDAERVIFADDDRIEPSGYRTKPHFKPDWNAELYFHHDYLTGACVVRIDREDIEAAAQELDWAGALVASAIRRGRAAGHIRQVLHHRITRRAPRLRLPGLSLSGALPRVSVIIPTRNRVDLLTTCIAGLTSTDYPDIEAIVVDNDSDDPATLAFLADLPARGVRVLQYEGPFNYSAINNRAVSEATGELICLLNNDIEMRHSDWLTIMATQAMRDEVGAVGAQLLYPDGRLQHAGVVIGVGNAAGHAHRFLHPEEEGYFRRHALPQFTAAVTAACLVVKRDRFLAVGGLDETRFKVAFNDVDLCLRLNGQGWQSLYEPRAVLVHHESVSRGFDRDPEGAARFASELSALQHLWRTDEIVDPFHHPRLSRASEQFAVNL